MALSFAGVGSLAAVAGGRAVEASRFGHAAALLLMALFGLSLLFPVFPALAERLGRPLVRLGERLSKRAEAGGGPWRSVGPSLLVGGAVGLLWAPCAGPILGVIRTGAVIGGGGLLTPLLLLAWAWVPPPPWPWSCEPAGGWPQL